MIGSLYGWITNLFTPGLFDLPSCKPIIFPPDFNDLLFISRIFFKSPRNFN